MKRTTSNKLFLQFFPAIADCLRITNDKRKLIYDKKKIEVWNHLEVILLRYAIQRHGIRLETWLIRSAKSFPYHFFERMAGITRRPHFRRRGMLNI